MLSTARASDAKAALKHGPHEAPGGTLRRDVFKAHAFAAPEGAPGILNSGEEVRMMFEAVFEPSL